MRRFAYFISLVCIFSACTADESADNPFSLITLLSQPGPIWDGADMLSSTEIASLSNLLEEKQAQTGVEVGIVIVPSQGEGDIFSLSLEIGQHLKLGQAGLNNSALIILARDERQLKVEVDHGLEWQIPAEKAAEIFGEIRTHFQQDRYVDGFQAGIEAIYAAIDSLPWQVQYPSATAWYEAPNPQAGEIVSLFAKGKTGPYNQVPLEIQFHPDLQIPLLLPERPPIQLFFSNYMVEMVNAIVYPTESLRPKIYARMLSEKGDSLQLMGITLAEVFEQ